MRTSMVRDIRAVPESFTEFKALRSGVLAHLRPGDALYIPMMWWHYVEHVRHTPRPMSFSISWVPHSMEDPYNEDFNYHSPGKDAYDTARRRILLDQNIQFHLAHTYGGHTAVVYLRLLGAGAFLAGEARAAVRASRAARGAGEIPVPAAEYQAMHDELLPQLTEQIEARDLLRPNETVVDFMMMITAAGQFEFPTAKEQQLSKKKKKKKKKKRKMGGKGGEGEGKGKGGKEKEEL